MILQRIALFAIETETLPRGLTNSRIFHDHFGYTGKCLGEGRHFQVEVDQQVMVIAATVAQTQYYQAFGFGFLRGARSITQALTRGLSASLTRIWSMRRPRFF